MIGSALWEDMPLLQGVVPLTRGHDWPRTKPNGDQIDGALTKRYG